MESRYKLILLVFAFTVWAPFASNAGAQFQAQSTNFVVIAPDAQLAQKVASEAERFRKQLAIEWLGYELPKWRQKCPIKVQLSMHAGGETSFAFVRDGNAEPMDWDMQIFGPPDRLLDAVLPHEVTHTIFATHFRRPLPRWADEGACTTVEHETEKAKNHQMLMRFLSSKPSRGIPFNRMFTMREYPHDILPLYAQGFSLAKFLIMQKGKRPFVDYIGEGMDAEVAGRETQTWDRVTHEHYGFDNLSDLQLSWLKWVKEGSQAIAPEPAAQIAANPIPLTVPTTELPISPNVMSPVVAANFVEHQAAMDSQSSWYAQQASVRGDLRTTTNRTALKDSPEKSRILRR